MKGPLLPVTQVSAALAAFLAPAAALACRSYCPEDPGGCACAGAAPLAAYLSAVGIGVLVGLGSVSAQDWWRGRRR
jgi:hypothetical protein